MGAPSAPADAVVVVGACGSPVFFSRVDGDLVPRRFLVVDGGGLSAATAVFVVRCRSSGGRSAPSKSLKPTGGTFFFFYLRAPAAASLRTVRRQPADTHGA